MGRERSPLLLPRLGLAWLVAWLVACATATRATAPAPAPEVIAVARTTATTPLPEAPKPAPAAALLRPLGWTITEGGGAGFLPVGGGGSFMAVDSAEGIRETLRTQPRIAFSLTPARLCALASALEPARGQVSIDLDIMSPLGLDAARCLAQLHPPAFSFAMPSPPGPMTPAVREMLSHLDDCEALGVSGVDDAVAQLLGDHAGAPDGASLRSLALVQGRLSAPAYASIAKWKRLRELGFRGTRAVGPAGSPTGIAALATLPDLERLDLSYGDVTDADLAAFAASKRLTWLMLESTTLQGPGVAALAGLRELTYVNLDFTRVDDATVEALAQLPRVRFLGLARTRVTDRGVSALARMTSLEEVILELTQVTEASLPVLASLPRLRVLSLPGTIPQPKVDAFRAAHPKLDVRYWP